MGKRFFSMSDISALFLYIIIIIIIIIIFLLLSFYLLKFSFQSFIYSPCVSAFRSDYECLGCHFFFLFLYWSKAQFVLLFPLILLWDFFENFIVSSFKTPLLHSTCDYNYIKNNPVNSYYICKSNYFAICHFISTIIQ